MIFITKISLVPSHQCTGRAGAGNHHTGTCWTAARRGGAAAATLRRDDARNHRARRSGQQSPGLQSSVGRL